MELESAPQSLNKDFGPSHNNVQSQDKLLKYIDPKTNN